MERGNFAQSLIEGVTEAANLETTRPAESQAVASGSSGPFLLLSGYGAANHSPSRGYLYWPTAKTRFELQPLAAEEIRRRIHWLMANFGFARRLVFGMAKTAGMITPFADTGNDEWDELVEENFLERAASPEVFDVAGKFDFWTAQYQMNVNRWKDGDCLAVPTDPEGYEGVQLAFYEGSQITDEGLDWRTAGRKRRAEWWDGVKTDRFGKHTRYRVQDGNERDRFRELPARSAYYYANLESHHAVRGISILAAAVVNMVDVVETRGFTKKRLKEDANTGKVIEQDAPTVAFTGGGGIGGQVVQAAVPMPDGTTQSVNWKIASGGGEIPTMAPGQKIRVVADDRQTPNARDFEENLLRDCTFAADQSFEALFKIADLKGPASRFVLAEIRRWVSNQMRYQARFVRWYRALHITGEIRAGRLPKPKEDKRKPLWWLRAAYIGQADLTIDEGRKGNLALVNLESGLTTWAKEWGEIGGLFWKNPIRQRIREVAWAKEQAAAKDLTLAEVFPKLAQPEPTAAPGDEPRPA